VSINYIFPRPSSSVISGLFPALKKWNTLQGTWLTSWQVSPYFCPQRPDRFQVEAYFARLHFLMPVLDKPSFLEQYQHLMDNKDNLRVVRSQAGFLSLLFALFACAAPLVDDPRLTADKRIDEGGMGMIYYERYAFLSSLILWFM
jgi:hypothetical protein